MHRNIIRELNTLLKAAAPDLPKSTKNIRIKMFARCPEIGTERWSMVEMNSKRKKRKQKSVEMLAHAHCYETKKVNRLICFTYTGLNQSLLERITSLGHELAHYAHPDAAHSSKIFKRSAKRLTRILLKAVFNPKVDISIRYP